MNFDPDKLLDLERRTGVKNTDIDDFLSKADSVEQAIKALMSGDTSAIEKEEKKLKEKQAREADEKKREEERKERIRVSNEALRLKLKDEEREKWWTGAEFYVTRDKSVGDVDIDEDSSAFAKSQKKMIDKYTLDYSRWDEWKPSDPVSIEEENVKKEAEEKAANDLFEKNNPEFCTQTLEDMKERRRSREAKIESSNERRLRGNNLFKKGQIEEAHQCYMEALKLAPYDTKIIMNIAQCDIKLNHYDDAMEFLRRLLYCEPDHVKGLSRKAFILNSRGEVDEALKAVSLALKKDPTNLDLIQQKSELDDLISERQRKNQVEKLTSTLNETTSKAATDEKKAEVLLNSLSKMSEEDSYSVLGIHLLDSVNIKLDKLLMVFDAAVDESGKAKTRSKEDVDALEKSLIQIELCESSVKGDENLKLYFRTSGMLEKISKFLSNLLTKTLFLQEFNKPIGEYLAKTAGAGVAAVEVRFVHLVMRLLSTSVYGDRLSTEIILDCGLVSDMLGALSKALDPFLMFGFMKICHAVIDKISSKIKNPFLKTPKTLSLLNDVVMGSSNILLQTQASGNDAVAVHDILEDTIICGISIFKCIVLTEWYSDVKNFQVLQSFILTTAFCVHTVLSTSLKSPDKDKTPKTKKDAIPNQMEKSTPRISYVEQLELMLGTLLAMSQNESTRNVFNQKFAPTSASSSKGELSSTIDILFDSFCKSERFSGNNELNQLVTGALLNITIGDTSNDIKNSIFKAGGMDYSMSGLRASPSKRSEIAKADNTLSLVRKAALLSRLVLLEPVQAQLNEPANYTIISKYVAQNGIKFTQLQPWEADELSHVVRVLAGVTKPSAALLNIVRSEKVVEALINVLPKPREDLGKITPMSVVLPPLLGKISDNLLGNIARCLMHYADDEMLCKIIFNDGVDDDSKRLSSNFGTEKLICAMATSSDTKVRKNIAILLAKGCRVPLVREKVTSLRGMQMIIELNNSKQLL